MPPSTPHSKGSHPLDRLLDTSALRENRVFRQFWLGSSLQSVGRQITIVAVLFQVWEFTHSTVWLGVFALATGVVMVICGLLGGSFADTHDRRRITMVTTVGALGMSVGLAVQAAVGLSSLVPLLVLLMTQTAFSSFGSPARRAILARVLREDQLGSGIALFHLSFQISMLAGPALAGLIIAQFGLTACYILEAVAFAAGFYGLVGLPALPPEQDGESRSIGGSIAQGLRFIRSSKVVKGCFATDLASTVLVMPITLLPAINEERYGGSPQTLGFMMSAIAIGGVTAATLSGPVTRYALAGRVQLAAALIWCGSLAALGISNTPLAMSLSLLAIAGACDTIAVISRGTIVQLATPDAYRGRVSAVEGVVGVAGPELGNFRGGAIAGITSANISVATGGLAGIAAIIAIAMTNKDLRDYRTPATTG